MFGLFTKKNKDFIASVNENSFEVKVIKGKTLLSSALDQGIDWPHRCKVGSCGSCKCKIISGKIKPQIDFAYVLDQDELDAGYVLACQSELKSDIEVEVIIKNKQE